MLGASAAAVIGAVSVDMYRKYLGSGRAGKTANGEDGAEPGAMAAGMGMSLPGMPQLLPMAMPVPQMMPMPFMMPPALPAAPAPAPVPRRAKNEPLSAEQQLELSRNNLEMAKAKAYAADMARFDGGEYD